MWFLLWGLIVVSYLFTAGNVYWSIRLRRRASRAWQEGVVFGAGRTLDGLLLAANMAGRDDVFQFIVGAVQAEVAASETPDGPAKP